MRPTALCSRTRRISGPPLRMKTKRPPVTRFVSSAVTYALGLLSIRWHGGDKLDTLLVFLVRFIHLHELLLGREPRAKLSGWLEPSAGLTEFRGISWRPLHVISVIPEIFRDDGSCLNVSGNKNDYRKK